MNPFKFAMRRPVTVFVMPVVVVGGAIYGLYKTRTEIPRLHTSRLYERIDALAPKLEHFKELAVHQYEKMVPSHKEEEVHHEPHKIVVTRPIAKDVVITQDYVCQIHSQRHIEVQALDNGYLEEISVKEGQAVKKGDPMFRIVSTLYQAKYDAEVAERDLAQLELNNTKRLAERQGVSLNEVKLFEAKLAKAQAKADLAKAELNFATVRAPFDGIVDRLQEQLGSLIKEGDILTTLSDNSVMWVYFNVPEKRYLEYMADPGKDSPDIELVLADGNKFKNTGKIGAIEANFNTLNGNIAFRADFPNPERLLRHGQTGTVLIHRVLKGATVIPQRATFENLAKRYVYVLDKDDTAHQREIVVQNELEDIYVIKSGFDVKDRIILEGVRQVREGEKVEFEFIQPELVIANQKNKAE